MGAPAWSSEVCFGVKMELCTLPRLLFCEFYLEFFSCLHIFPLSKISPLELDFSLKVMERPPGKVVGKVSLETRCPRRP